MNKVDQPQSLKKGAKKMTWKAYFGSAMIFIVFTFLLSAYFVSAINGYLIDIFTKQATSLAESYTETLDLSSIANTNINQLLDDRLEVSLLSFEQHVQDILNNPGRILEYKERSKVDEVFIFNTEGVIIESASSEFIGWRLPDDHPVREFLESDETYKIDQIRRASESEAYYKYGYVKDGFGHVIQVGISADNIASFNNAFSPQNLKRVIESNPNILLADVYMYDETNFLFELNPDITFFDRYELDAFKTDKLIYRMSDKLDEPSLQIFVPLEIQNERMGTLIIFHSMAYYQQVVNKTMFLVGSMIFILLLIIAYLLCSYYVKDRNIQLISYTDLNSGLYNRKYFNEYIKENFNTLRSNQSYFVILSFNNYVQLKLLLDEKEFNNTTTMLIDLILSEAPSRDFVIQYYDAVLVLIYHNELDVDRFHRNSEAFIEKVNKMNVGGTNIEVKLGLLQVNDRYNSDHEVSSNIAAAIKQLGAPQTPNIYIFTSDIWNDLIYKEQLINDLRKAYLNHFDDEFYVVFQPIVDRTLNQVVCFEALARWNHPKLGMVSPATFIEISEQSNLIIPLGEKIIQQSLNFVKEIRRHGFEKLCVSINISYAQLIQPHFVEKLSYMINREQVPFNQIALEITESILIDDFDMLNEKLNALRQMGVRILLDDFGVGYSSIERINNLSVDYLKVDKSFVKLIEEDEELVKGIFSLTTSLNYPVVAEGVETLEQIKWLEQNGCHLFQGFYYSEGLAKREAIRFLQTSYHPDK